MDDRLLCSFSSMQQCEIEIGSNLLSNKIVWQYLHSLRTKIALITDTQVQEIYGHRWLKECHKQGLTASLFHFPVGEKHKTRETKEQLENQLFAQRFGKDTCIIALGGGVVTDLAGYLAATFCRGVPLILMPTTLLGMVDASIGGKTGVNTPFGKNLIGCIYQPKKVWMDVTFLNSLPKKELLNGFMEILKHAVVYDFSFFQFLSRQFQSLLSLNQKELSHAILRSVQIKKEIVEDDEHETGKRRILNFGHTIGHAIELLSAFKVSHGEAVAIGMLGESYLSYLLGYLQKKDLVNIVNLIQGFISDLTCIEFAKQGLLKIMSMDKKAIKNCPRFVLLENIGTCKSFDGAYCSVAPEEAMIKTIQYLQVPYAMCHH